MKELLIFVKNPRQADPNMASIGWKADIGNEKYGCQILVPADSDINTFVQGINLMAVHAYDTEKELLSLREER